LDCLVVNCGVITIRNISKANQTPRKSSRPPGLFILYLSETSAQAHYTILHGRAQPNRKGADPLGKLFVPPSYENNVNWNGNLILSCKFTSGYIRFVL
jgi:hypothetical protein